MRRNVRNKNKRMKNKSDAKKKSIVLKGSLIVFISLITILILSCLIYFISFRYNSDKFTNSVIELSNKLKNEDLNKKIDAEKRILDERNKEISEEVKRLDEEKRKREEKTDISFSITAIGDVICHNTQYKDAYIPETDSYDFSYVYEDISNYTKFGDLTIANLETTFGGKERGYSNYPRFNSPDEIAPSLKKIGIDVVTTAANHALDTNYTGLCRTIDVLDKYDIDHLGTYKTKEDQEKIYTKYIKGLKVGILNYTYGTNGIPVPSDKPYCVNLIDKNLIKTQIEKCKSDNMDVIIACMHWGVEYRSTPTDEQKELCDFLFKNGVDVVIGNHPHVLEPMEKRIVTMPDGSTKECFVVYSLGNFVADQNTKNTRNSAILSLFLTKHVDGKLSIDRAKYTPIYMYKNNSLKTRKMKLIDINKAIYNYENYIDRSIGENLYNTLKSELKNVVSVLGPEIN